MTQMPQRGRIVGATVFAALGVALLIGLGVWQIERKAWKDALVAQLSARLGGAPQALPPPGEWPRLDAASEEFRHVVFAAEFAAGENALVYTPGSSLRPDVSGAGYWVLSPARLSGGGTVVINRGFIPVARKDTALPPPTGPQRITGALRWPEARGWFTPADDPAHGVWYAREPKQIAAAKDWGEVAPFYVELESPQAAGGLPRAGRLAIVLPNNHLQYALTWFALAAGLVAVYLTWLFTRARRG
jgi:surfeit locus 1 family protein